MEQTINYSEITINVSVVFVIKCEKLPKNNGEKRLLLGENDDII